MYLQILSSLLNISENYLILSDPFVACIMTSPKMMIHFMAVHLSPTIGASLFTFGNQPFNPVFGPSTICSQPVFLILL